MVDNRQGGAGLAGVGLNELLSRAAADDGFRQRLIAERAAVAAQIGVTLSEAEARVLSSVSDDALAQMIDGLASSQRARLQPPPPVWGGSGGPPVATGIAPDMPPMVSLGISPDMPPPVSRGISPDMPALLTGIGPDMPPEWKQNGDTSVSGRLLLVVSLLLLLVVAAALGLWLAR